MASIFSRSSHNSEAPVKTHLRNVYQTVGVALIAAAVGGYAHLYMHLGGGLLSTLGTLGFGIALFTSHDSEKNRATRLGYLNGFAFCSGRLIFIRRTDALLTRSVGLSMGPLLEMAIMINPALVPSALLYGGIIFACFSLSTIFADHRKYLYLGGTLMSMLSVLVMMSLVNIFLRSSFIFATYLYLGLLVTCGFVMYDTALIIEKRRMGETDYVSHALLLFIDFVDLFRHILILLTKREAERERKRRN